MRSARRLHTVEFTPFPKGGPGKMGRVAFNDLRITLCGGWRYTGRVVIFIMSLYIAYHSALVSPAPFGSALVTITPFLEGVNTGMCSFHHYRDRERQKTREKVYITLYLQLSHANGAPSCWSSTRQ
jgi:hypothetical protein